MRFLHKDATVILDHLGGGEFRIRQLDWDLNPAFAGCTLLPWTIRRRKAKPPQLASAADIEELIRETGSPENPGSTLRIYFHVNAPPSDRAVSLGAAIEHVEAFGAANEFLLLGYHDGGLISVSRHLLPFQEGEKDIGDWWRMHAWTPS